MAWWALLALGLISFGAHPACASRVIKDYLLAGTWTGPVGGQVTGYTPDDTVMHTTLRLTCYGATAVRFMVGSEMTGTYNTTDSVYVDSMAVFKVQVSDDSVSWKDMVISNSSSSVRGLYWYGEQVQGAGVTLGTTRAANLGYHVFSIFGDFSSGNNVFNIPSAILVKYVRIQYQPYTRGTLSGFVATQGTRTKGIRGLKIIARVYYDNP